MSQLKRLSKEAIPKALEKADRYRLLNEPMEAESICRDVLDADPGNQEALQILALALTDQFGDGELERHSKAAVEVVGRMRDPYALAYYSGVISERRGKALLEHVGAGGMAYELLRVAMTWFEKAEHLRPTGNDDALLRWNTCVRVLDSHPNLREATPSTSEPYLE